MALNTLLTLRWKILLGVIFVSLLSVLLASGIFVTMDNTRISEAMSRENELLAKVVAGNLAGALTFGDADSGMTALDTFKANPQIIGAVVFNESGELFASYQRNNGNKKAAAIPSGFPSSAPPPKSQFTDDYLEVSHRILTDGEAIGTIYIRVDLGEMIAARNHLLEAVAITTLIAIAFSAVLALLIQKSIVRPINAVVSALKDIAEGEGDLTQRLPVNSDDELGELARWFNIFIEKVHGVIAKFSDTSENLSNSAIELLDTTKATNNGIIKQQTEIDQVASAVTEMSGTVQEIERNVANTANDAEQADNQAIQGREIVKQTMNAIEELASDIEKAADVIIRLQKESDNIGSVLEVIGGIAEQTNLLALNAAIEAARAGEQGRGFAVVADEVRTLASRTQNSTQEIQEMIERLQAGSREAVTMMEKGREQAANSVEYAEHAGKSLSSITAAVAVIKDMSHQIATASQEQSVVTEEINKNIINISQVASQTAADSNKIAENSHELSSLSTELRQLISQFKL